MMNITPMTPLTSLRILQNVPLDSSYSDTITFNSLADQTSFFSGKTKYLLTEMAPIRMQNQIRVPYTADQLYDCNYIMFQNANFNQKWFYAFITAIDFMNENMSMISFELDVMQTWYFDYTLQECFVEREHVNDDTVGLHTVPENLEHGEYITTTTTRIQNGSLNIYLLASELPDESVASYFNKPGIIGGFPVSCYWCALGNLSSFNIQVLESIIDAYAQVGKSDAIVSIFAAPSNFISTESDIRTQSLLCAPLTLSGKVKNNKLKCFPYTALAICANGQGDILRYENFSSSPALQIIAGFGANLQVVAYPLNYEGESLNIEHSLTIKDFPLLPWVRDYYQNWVAQNKSSINSGIVTNLFDTGVNALINLISGNPLGAISTLTSGISNIDKSVSKNQDQKVMPDSMIGSANAGDIYAVAGLTGFYTYCRTIKPEYLSIIDNYFTMFGYKVNALKVPNVTGRPCWNYVKTGACKATGSIPFDDMEKIKSIYDNGITFWHGDYVGNYSLNNQLGG